MSKVYILDDSEEELSYGFFCQGCRCEHFFRVRHKTFTRDNPLRPPGVPLWEWNGDFEKPTVSPSIDVHHNTPSLRCHSIMIAGKLQFLPDSYHHLKGQTVDMEDEH